MAEAQKCWVSRSSAGWVEAGPCSGLHDPWVPPPASPAPSLFQFLIYFVYFLVLFVAYVLAALLTGLRHFRQGRRQPPPPAQELMSPMQEPAAQDGLAPEDGVRAVGEQRQQPEAKA